MRCSLALIVLAACGSKHGKTDGGIDAPRCLGTDPCIESVSPAMGYVDGGAYLTLTGTGFAPGMKVFLGDGRAPVLVQSATAAKIVTPPGPAGAVDVRIVVGTTTYTLPAGYRYGTAGLELTWEQKPLMTVRGEDPTI